MQSIRVGNAKPSDLGADQPNVQNQQQNNAADVTRSPSQAGNTAHVFFGREVVEHRVVINRCEFEENIADAQKRNTKEEASARPQRSCRSNKEHQRQANNDQDREHCQGKTAFSTAICALTGNRCKKRNDDACGKKTPRKVITSGSLIGESPIAGQVDREDESRCNSIERCRTPVPQSPFNDRLRQNRCFLLLRRCHRLGGRRFTHVHSLYAYHRRPTSETITEKQRKRKNTSKGRHARASSARIARAKTRSIGVVIFKARPSPATMRTGIPAC